MSKKVNYSSCEIPAGSGKKGDNRNRHYVFQGDFTWKGVKTKEYKSKDDNWADIARHVLIGASGETTKFHLRYFEISSGGYSSFETHKHAHVVIGIRGKGKARLNRRNVDINFLDIFYIKPEMPHMLYNPYSEPFGFFCIVNSRRDRPRPVKAE